MCIVDTVSTSVVVPTDASEDIACNALSAPGKLLLDNRIAYGRRFTDLLQAYERDGQFSDGWLAANLPGMACAVSRAVCSVRALSQSVHRDRVLHS